VPLARHVILSVNRVGSAAQVPAMKKVAGFLKLTQYREVEAFVSFAPARGKTTLAEIWGGLFPLTFRLNKNFARFPVQEDAKEFK